MYPQRTKSPKPPSPTAAKKEDAGGGGKKRKSQQPVAEESVEEKIPLNFSLKIKLVQWRTADDFNTSSVHA